MLNKVLLLMILSQKLHRIMQTHCKWMIQLNQKIHKFNNQIIKQIQWCKNLILLNKPKICLKAMINSLIINQLNNNRLTHLLSRKQAKSVRENTKEVIMMIKYSKMKYKILLMNNNCKKLQLILIKSLARLTMTRMKFKLKSLKRILLQRHEAAKRLEKLKQILNK